MRIHSNSLPAALWSSTVYHGARRYIEPSLLQKGFIMIHLVCTNVGDARPLPFPVSNSTRFESFQRHKKRHNSACAAATAGRAWSLSAVSWQLTVYLPFLTIFKKMYKMREQLLIRAVQVWSEDTVTTIKALSNQFWLQTWGNCRAASKQRSTRAKEPTACRQPIFNCSSMFILSSFCKCFVELWIFQTMTVLQWLQWQPQRVPRTQPIPTLSLGWPAWDDPVTARLPELSDLGKLRVDVSAKKKTVQVNSALCQSLSQRPQICKRWCCSGLIQSLINKKYTPIKQSCPHLLGNQQRRGRSCESKGQTLPPKSPPLPKGEALVPAAVACTAIHESKWI